MILNLKSHIYLFVGCTFAYQSNTSSNMLIVDEVERFHFEKDSTANYTILLVGFLNNFNYRNFI